MKESKENKFDEMKRAPLEGSLVLVLVLGSNFSDQEGGNYRPLTESRKKREPVKFVLPRA